MKTTTAAVLLVVLVLAIVLLSWLGAYLRTEDMYSACREQGWYPVQKADDEQSGRVIVCSGLTGSEVQQAIHELETHRGYESI